MEQALNSLTVAGWCEFDWIGQTNHRRIARQVYCHVKWQVDTGDVHPERTTRPNVAAGAFPEHPSVCGSARDAMRLLACDSLRIGRAAA